MLDKIGNEASNLILDDVAVLLTDNQNMNQEIINKNEEIQKLKDLNSRLQQVNSNLLLQIPVNKEEKNEDQKERRKVFSMREAFDEKGNFKI
jgi:hypothetical protein